MNSRLALPFLLAAVLACAGCVHLQPVQDSAVRTSLSAKGAGAGEDALYPAPVFEVTLPAYLEESTVWIGRGDGRLRSLDDFLWADSLAPALRREFALALARPKPFPADFEIRIEFARFLVFDDGSAEALAETILSTDGATRALPLHRIRLADAWDPERPATFLEGYRALLESTAAKINDSLAASVKKP
jgi:uncharacterized lipoprotein YmbA